MVAKRPTLWGIVGFWVMLTSVTITAQTGTSESSSQSTSTPGHSTNSGSGIGSLPTAPSATKPEIQVHEERTGTSNDRLFWTLPNFLTVENARNIPRLSAGQKFKVVLRSSFDPVEYPYIGFLAGISQAEDSEPGFGQGAGGYAKRYGSAFADNTIENFMAGAILPSLLRQDPRYYQLGQGTFKHRLGYAISRIFVTRSDSGNKEFNASEVVGSAASAAIATYGYHPVEDRTFSNTASVWGTQVGWDAVAIGVKEFWPDIRRKVHRRHQVGRLSTNANSQQNSRR